MLVQCTYGPATTEVMGTSYTFEPDEYGRFIADIWNPKHLEAFLAVVHYRAVKKDPEPLVLESIEPATAELGSEDFVLHCHGSGFAPDTAIVFAGQPENTVFLSENELTTIVKPSLGWGAVTLPVTLRDYMNEETDPLDFTFTEGEAGADPELPDIPVTMITGVGPTWAKKLAAEGITSAYQIAAMSPEDLAVLDDALGLGGRTDRDGWIDQAKALIAG